MTMGRGEGFLAGRLRAAHRRRERRIDHEQAVLERHWGVECCALCGQTILLGEQVWRQHGELPLCRECAERLQGGSLRCAA